MRKKVSPVSRRAADFAVRQADVVIAVAFVFTAFGAILGAIAGGVAGSHPKYDALSGGLMKGAYVCFGIAAVLLVGLVIARESRRSLRNSVADFINIGYELFRRDVDEEGRARWEADVSAWNATVDAWLRDHLDRAKAAVFGHDTRAVPAQDSNTLKFKLGEGFIHDKLNLSKRIENLHTIMDDL